MPLGDGASPPFNAFPIEQFPDEILSLVLAFVRAASIEKFTSVLRVSRKWHNIGEDLVWRHLVLTRDNLARFVRNHKWQSRSHLSQRIQSLTFFVGSKSLLYYTRPLRFSGGELGYSLQAMTSLETVSFYH